MKLQIMDVLEEHVTFVFTVEEQAKQETSVKHIASRATRRYIPEGRTLHNRCCENLRSCKIYLDELY
jgi:hypothetical protein